MPTSNKEYDELIKKIDSKKIIKIPSTIYNAPPV